MRVLDKLVRVRGRDEKLLAMQEGRRWVPVTPSDVNDYIREVFGLEVTAKDFRTWHATVHVATALAGAPTARSKTARNKVVRAAVVGASQLLGNTPTVCRASYVDPRVVDKMVPYLREQFGNPASRSHAYGWTAEHAVEEAREAVFRRFHSIRPSDEAFGRHSGLGLAIARTIVDGHQGQIAAEARDDRVRGARFVVRLPLADGSKEE